MKGVLVELVPAGAASIRSQVNEVMDMTLYRQQIQQQTFDVGSVVKFVVDIMLMLCAPARDPSIRFIIRWYIEILVYQIVKFSRFYDFKQSEISVRNYQ